MGLPMSEIPRFLVAELSRNWPHGKGLLLSQRFEAAIETNHRRGYKLHSWRLSRINNANGELNETIIAVFELVDPERAHEQMNN
jgi:hypothetical protein